MKLLCIQIMIRSIIIITITIIFSLAIHDIAFASKSNDFIVQMTKSIQRFYVNTNDFTSLFVQRYTFKALNRTDTSEGKVFMKKPGKIRWDYQKPTEKFFIANGNSFWIYEPDNRQVIINNNFKNSQAQLSISFLWGDGNITSDFDVSELSPNMKASCEKIPDTTCLLLTPKKKEDQVTQMHIAVAKQTSAIVGVTVFDAIGNSNFFTFSKLKTNVGLNDKHFNFSPPQGVTIIDMANQR